MGKTKTKIIDDGLQANTPPPKEKAFHMEKPTHPQEEPKKEFKIERPKKESSIEAKEKQVKEVGREKKLAKEQEKIPTPQKVRSKKYQARLKLVDRGKLYPLTEAVELIKKTSYTKFNGSIEAHINTISKNLRGLISLPYLSGKKLTILAFGKGAEEAGGDLVGDEKTLEEIKAGKIKFDVLVTTPEWMPKLAQVAKILGPKGLMPNPKNNTVTDNLKKTIQELKGGKIEYKTEPNGQIIHLLVGKVDQPSDEIQANLKSLLNTMGKSKVEKITLAPTMGPGVKVDLTSI